MTEKPTTFPQHATRPPAQQRTIANILEFADGMMPVQTMELITAASTITLACR